MCHCRCPSLQVGVSFVLSFMLVWDMPSIASGVASLRSSRLAPFYNEVAPALSVFGKLFGKALEAQVRNGCPACMTSTLRSRSACSCCDCRAWHAYLEIAPAVSVFGRLLGKALEAQYTCRCLSGTLRAVIWCGCVV
jgi:hypothetical protein